MCFGSVFCVFSVSFIDLEHTIHTTPFTQHEERDAEGQCSSIRNGAGPNDT